ncbi:GAF domain-containing protein [Actinoplanes sp. NPDC020271]|uniref:helix-turn-helix domain-containing protein n=1 Tax=Actinoplanes sp. NPDC020271 TaxID=3363896 RepID=UPI003792E124
MNPWLALTPGDDPAERIRQVGRAHERFLAGNIPPERMRAVVAESWARSARSIGADSTAPIDLCDDELEAYRSAHPLARVVPLFRDLLGGLADDGDHILAVCDAHGRLLWVEGHAGTLRGAASMNFVPGARWDEAHAGTNAPGTALAVDHALQIFATEHFSRSVQRWTCTAAPIHDPGGRLLGAIDVTGGDHLANPHSLALVRATALAAESYLQNLEPARPGPSVAALGRDEAVFSTGKVRTHLKKRHSELLVLLTMHPGGRTGDQLGFDLYGDDVNPVTVRAELSRLRRILGPELLDSRPYRLRTRPTTDFGTAMSHLESGQVSAALAAYPGPLLPGSDAPGIVRLRRMIDDRLRAAILGTGDRRLLQTWLNTPGGADDLEIWEAYTRLAPHDLVAARRTADLTREYACNVRATST